MSWWECIEVSESDLFLWSVMEAFAEEVYKQCGESLPFKTQDCAFVLAFSLIMLNTDLHNPRCVCAHKWG